MALTAAKGLQCAPGHTYVLRLARAISVRSLVLVLLAGCSGGACKLVHPPYASSVDGGGATTTNDGFDAAGPTNDTSPASNSQSTSAPTTETPASETGTPTTATSVGSSDGTTTTGAESDTSAQDSTWFAHDGGPNGNIPDASSSSNGDLTDTGATSGSANGSGVSSDTDAGSGCVHLTNPAFLDFANVSPLTTSGGDATWEFSMEGGVTGTVYVASQHLTSEVVAGTPAKLHMSGLVEEYAQFGVHFTPCVDASSFSGVTVELAGDVGPNNRVRFEVQLTSSTMHANNPQGTCVPQDPNAWWNDCSHPDFALTLPTPGAPVDSPWDTFTDGVPNDHPVPSTITGLEVEFDWDPNLAVSFDADLTVSKLAFLP